MALSDKLVITKITNEPFFIQCADNLRAPSGVQAASIASIVECRLEKRVTLNPETWEVAIPYSGGFSSLQILDDGDFTAAMIAGEVNADLDQLPEPGDNYMLVVECTITFGAAFGGATTGKVFRRQARIAYGAVTSPYSG